MLSKLSSFSNRIKSFFVGDLFKKRSFKIRTGLITIQDNHTIYEEHIEYFLVPSINTPIIIYPTWKKNKVKISSNEIPSTIFQLLAAKHPSDIIYSSHPL